MKGHLYLIPLLSVLTTGCVSQPKAIIDANAVIRWSNGIEEQVKVASANEHLVFVQPSFMSQQVVIYSRIIGAGTTECEYYVSEPSPNVRLTLCRDGDVELLNKGQTINIGHLDVYQS